MVVCGGDSNDPELTWQKIVDQVQVIVREGIDEAAFTRLKKSMMGRRVKDLDSFESTCFRLCAYYFDKYDYLRFPELFARVTREEVLAFLRENVRTEHSAMSVVNPRTEVTQ